jgi:hypothetical protein
VSFNLAACKALKALIVYTIIIGNVVKTAEIRSQGVASGFDKVSIRLDSIENAIAAVLIAVAAETS